MILSSNQIVKSVVKLHDSSFDKFFTLDIFEYI